MFRSGRRRESRVILRWSILLWMFWDEDKFALLLVLVAIGLNW